ncbi:MAG TPA: type 1 glutamine amidotransferase [Gaiellaceae bacterium]
MDERFDSGSFRALIIEHERATPGGLLYDWLDGRHAEVENLRIDVDDREVDPTGYDLVVPLGSESAAYDDAIPWIEREKRLLARAADADVPILAICFGAQLLARVLGGRCYRAEASEIGWLPVRTRDAQLVPEGPWFQWHFDTFTVPEGATALAETDLGPQAYVIGRSLGVQFHPEVTSAIVKAWVRGYRHDDGADRDGLELDALLRETHERAESARESSRRLFDTYLERVARLMRRERVDA